MNGRTVWINTDDVDGLIEEGHVVTATRPLADFCLRGDDGSEPVATGSLLEVVETRRWGAAMAQELPDVQPLDTSPASILQAMLDLEAEGLWEFETDTRPEVAPTGAIETVERTVTAVRR